MNSIAASQFETTCLEILEHVLQTGEPVLVTRQGKPIAQIQPPPAQGLGRKSAFGCMRGRIEIIGDIMEP